MILLIKHVVWLIATIIMDTQLPGGKTRSHKHTIIRGLIGYGIQAITFHVLYFFFKP